ncbi:hypothetical protein VTO42DRAFT_5136 [Malbranchea cinnamomea]
MVILSFLLLFIVFDNVLAFVQFVQPRPGAVLTSKDAVEIVWGRRDIDDAVVFEHMRFDLFLCTGGNEDASQEQLATLIQGGLLAESNSVSVRIDPRVGGEHPNAYFLRMVFDGGDSDVPLVINSGRFTLTDMTGAFSATVAAALQSISTTTTDGPSSSSSDVLARRQAAGAVALSAQIPYADQTGPTRYAPMPKQPGTKITLKSAEPLFPTSSYEIATTFLPTPTVETTVSQPAQLTATSMENTAAPAPQPTDDMEKFLNRWKD